MGMPEITVMQRVKVVRVNDTSTVVATHGGGSI